MRIYMRCVIYFFSLFMGWVNTLNAQTLQLRERGTNTQNVSVQVGETITIEVFAELSGVEAAGMSVFVTVPTDAFQVVDQRPTTTDDAGQPGIQPFVAGSLFAGAGEQANELIPESESIASSFEGQQLEYGIVVGGGGNRVRTGSGVVATFQLVCVQPIDFGQIQVNDNAVLETRLVLSDGISEKRFITVQGMQISVSGLELFDIPDVVLTPGQVDTTQIGILTRYIQSARPNVNLDSMKWSYEPADLDSIDIDIDPVTKRVRITPDPAWSGRQRIVWTVTEPASSVRSGEPALSVQEISDVIVNNPPSFVKERDPDGVRRDTVRLAEDTHYFVPGTEPNVLRALSAIDLNAMAIDPDGDGMRFLSLNFSVNTTPNLSTQVASQSNMLLLWTRQDYYGVDSLRVLASDGLRGGNDTLRVIVEVSPVPDPPRFLLSGEKRMLTIGIGQNGIYKFNEIVEDVDSPLDSLSFSWIDDPDGNFTVDTTRVNSELEINISGRSGFAGDGRISFVVTDTDSLQDKMTLLLTAAEALPPTALSDDIKIGLSPDGQEFVINLNEYVIDPDNSFDQLQWILPSNIKSMLRVEGEELIISAPSDFIGYEEGIVRIVDPDGLVDEIKLRIYSSDRKPEAGGVPDLVLDRGEVYQGLDLNNYYYDSNDDDKEVFWGLSSDNSFNQDNVRVQIDPLTHIVTFFAPETANFATEPIIFRVTDQAGMSSVDTMMVSIRSGGGNIPDQFTIGVLPIGLEVGVNQRPDLFDLDDYVIAPEGFDLTSLAWEVAVLAGDSSAPRIKEGNIVSAFGFQSGTDTLLFTAQDSLGRVQSARMALRVVGESEVMRITSMPDIQFIAGQVFKDYNLNDYIEDKETHPDSLIQWAVTTLVDSELIIRVTSDQAIQAISDDTLEVSVVFTARNVESGIVGRDTVRVIALDPSLASLKLRDLPPIVVSSGQSDSSVVLNDFLPLEFIEEDGSVPPVSWSVSGQRITQPFIDPFEPHALRINGVGDRVGVDSLTFVANIRGGFSAVGVMVVTVVEPVDQTTLELQVVPNPIQPSYINVFVVARRALAGTPNVIRSFSTIDSTVAVRQIEDDLEGRGVLIWSGGIELSSDASGLVSFEAQAITELGTNVGDTASVDIATVLAGKAVALSHGEAQLDIRPNALEAGKRVVLQVEKAIDRSRSKRSSTSELTLSHTIRAMPVDALLAQGGQIRWSGTRDERDGIYRKEREEWVYIGSTEAALDIDRLGIYGILRDEVSPRLIPKAEPNFSRGVWAIEIEEKGSGLGVIEVRIDGRLQPGIWDGQFLRWEPTNALHGEIEVLVSDRAGNVSMWRAKGTALPLRVGLEPNYPNPFNPKTVIPFVVSPQVGSVRLVIFNATGQMVRELLNRGQMSPGRHEVVWDGRDTNGFKVSSGVYIYRLQAGEKDLVRRMTLLK